jgi:hypothetical protein
VRFRAEKYGWPYFLAESGDQTVTYPTCLVAAAMSTEKKFSKAVIAAELDKG